MNLIPLTPVDYIFTGPGAQPITFVFEFPGKIAWQFLKESLTEVLKVFPVVSSKLILTDKKNYAYRLSGEGLDFSVARKKISLSDTGNLEEYIKPVQSVPGQPLIRIQVTQITGRTILGVSISHALADGFSYFHFLSSWARMAKGQKFMPPVMQRDLVQGNPKSSDVPFDPEIFIQNTGVFPGPLRNDIDPGKLKIDRLNFSQEEIGDLLKEANPPENVKLTANDILTSFLWKKYATEWFSEGEVYISCPFDFRGILSKIPRTYFGCAILCASTSLELNRLKQSTIGDLALRIRQAVNDMTPDKITRGLDLMEALRDHQGIGAMEKIHVRHPSHGMIVTNLSRMPLQDIDFGTGPPVSFLAHSDIDRGAAILPAKDGVEILVYR